MTNIVTGADDFRHVASPHFGVSDPELILRLNVKDYETPEGKTPITVIVYKPVSIGLYIYIMILLLIESI